MTTSQQDEISMLDGHDQAALVRKREVSPAALIEAAKARIEKLNPAYNAVVHTAFEEAIARAEEADLDAPMPGVPYLLKASMEYPGFPMVSGSRARKWNTGKSKYPFAQAMDAAGLIPCGMSAMPEFGLIGTGEALLYGPTRNPWNTEHSSGGSSSGAGVAVATGMVPFATGSDGGGSIRIPASHCGIVGFKPSRNWNLRTRAASLIDDLLASDALYGRSMRDTIWAAQTLRAQPPSPVDKPRALRIAVSLKGLDGLPPDPEVADVIGKTAALCETLGHKVEPKELPLNMAALSRAFDILWCYGGGEVADLCRAKLGDDAESLLEPWTLSLAARRDRATPDALEQALTAISFIPAQLENVFSDYDVILSPVTSGTAPELGVLAPDRNFDDLWRDHFRHVNYTQLQNMAGFPGISLPLFMASNGMPAGSMFWAGRGADDLLLSLGAQLEEAQPWKDRWPPMPS